MHGVILILSIEYAPLQDEPEGRVKDRMQKPQTLTATKKFCWFGFEVLFVTACFKCE